MKKSLRVLGAACRAVLRVHGQQFDALPRGLLCSRRLDFLSTLRRAAGAAEVPGAAPRERYSHPHRYFARDHLSPYGSSLVETPNFQRLADRGTTFDKAYLGSYPCMPARRDLWTGRYEFPWRGWGPLEWNDHSLPEVLAHAESRVGWSPITTIFSSTAQKSYRRHPIIAPATATDPYSSSIIQPGTTHGRPSVRRCQT